MLDNTTRTTSRIREWVRAIFDLPASAKITIESCVSKDNSELIQTILTLQNAENKSAIYTIKKPLSEITIKDIKRLRRFARWSHFKQLPVFGALFRFFGLWFAFSGLYAMFAVCPFCGQPGCPTGAGTAGLVGGFMAMFLQNWKNFWHTLFRKRHPRADQTEEQQA
ncbi:hypothetical protein JXJ21_06150 [candidate division KSB1 bacterium]|nr:hypothetical protein [candidate division KSB1 bacterium]